MTDKEAASAPTGNVSLLRSNESYASNWLNLRADRGQTIGRYADKPAIGQNKSLQAIARELPARRVFRYMMWASAIASATSSQRSSNIDVATRMLLL